MKKFIMIVYLLQIAYYNNVFFQKRQILLPKGWLQKYISVSFIEIYLPTKLLWMKSEIHLGINLVYIKCLWKYIFEFIKNNFEFK